MVRQFQRALEESRVELGHPDLRHFECNFRFNPRTGELVGVSVHSHRERDLTAQARNA